MSALSYAIPSELLCVSLLTPKSVMTRIKLLLSIVSHVFKLSCSVQLNVNVINAAAKLRSQEDE